MSDSISRRESQLNDPHYDPTTVWLHWATVALVVVLWIIGMTADWLPRGPLRNGAWSVHVLLGFATTLVLLTRIAWRAHFGRILSPADTGVLHAIAKATHYALYVLLAAAIATGIINASYRGISLFDLWSVPRFGTGDSAIRRNINNWHELTANLFLFVAVCHAAAALVHQYVWRDHLLGRMR
jgi:cytochrome b561